MLDDKIKGIEQHFDELERRLSDPAVISNQREYTSLARERSQMSEVASAVREYRKVSDEIAEYKSYMEGDDADMRELAQAKMEGFTNEEMAKRLDCTVRSVERRLRLIRILWTQEE